MTKIDTSRSSQNVTAPSTTTTTALTADSDVASMGAPEAAATFDKAPTKRSSLFAPKSGGDSRVILPAGGGAGQLNNLEAIDSHSKKAGDFTEPRTVNGVPMFLTREGAQALDAMIERAAESGGTVKGEKDPTGLKRFLLGDVFAGREQHSGSTK